MNYIQTHMQLQPNLITYHRSSARPWHGLGNFSYLVPCTV